MTTSACPTPSSPSAVGNLTRFRRVMIVCLLAGYAVQIDNNMITVALPTIERGLQLTSTQATWAVSGYVLALALTLVMGGRLGDDHGRRRVLLVSSSLFVVATAACNIVPSGTWLAVARTLVGCIAGLALPQIVGLIQLTFGGRERGRAFGVYSSAISLSAVVAPLIGGALIDSVHSWRLVFGPSVIMALAALVLGYFLLPDDSGGRTTRLDLVGTALLGLSIVSIMYPLIQAGAEGAHPAWWLIAVGAVLLAGFCRWETRLERAGRSPLMRLGLLGIRSYSVGALTVMFFFAGYPGMILLTHLYLQNGLHNSAFSSAATTVPFGLSSAIAALIGGRLVHRYGRWIVVCGCVAVTVGVALSALLVTRRLGGDDVLVLIAPFTISGLGSGLIIAPNQTLALAEVPKAEASTAAGVYQVAMRVGQSMGTPLALTLYSTGLSHWHGDVFKAASFGMTSSAVLIGLAVVVRLWDILRGPRVRPAAADTLHPSGPIAYAPDEPGA
ncbi:MFS transporter [Streptomyces sp. NPDC056161]|uniref:MFS transporter n=1 Tax=Streptomyces sp. NPDC056161 TaxID=3345732 RepID=UPI0035DFA2BF